MSKILSILTKDRSLDLALHFGSIFMFLRFSQLELCLCLTKGEEEGGEGGEKNGGSDTHRL